MPELNVMAKLARSEPHRILSFYAMVAAVFLAAVGAVCLVGLQLGWLTVDLARPTESKVGTPAHGSVLKATGQTGYFSDFIPVDPSKVYKLSGFFRASSENAGTAAASRVYFGVRVYDKNRRAILNGPGAYRYAAANGVVLTGLEGWVKLQGEITGETDSGQNSFRPGTAFVKIVVVPSYGTNDVTTDFGGVAFSEMLKLSLPDYGDAN